jgi:hypothetical protein
MERMFTLSQTPVLKILGNPKRKMGSLEWKTLANIYIGTNLNVNHVT